MAGPPPWTAGATVAIVGARLIDGTGAPAVEGGTLVLEHGRITAVGADVTVPSGAVVVDGEGTTIVPGVVDTHVHLGFARDPADVVRGGVTAVRDLGWPPHRFAALARRAGTTGLLVRHVGQILTAPGGYPTNAAWAPEGTGLEVGSIDGAMTAVDDAADGGAVAIKLAMEDRVGPVFDERTLAAIVGRAAERGLPTTVHAGTASAVEACLVAGVDELAHVPFQLTDASADLPERCAAAGMAVVPTLHCRHSDAPPEREAALAFLRRFVAAGGTVRYGTDLGNAHTSAGVDPEELRLLVACGLTPAQVVVAATGAAAVATGIGDLTGRLVPGLRADLLVLDEDPLLDVTALARSRIVAVAGRPVRW